MSSTIPIIILNWNGLEDTLECIPSVLQQTYSNFMIFLVDNGSQESDVIALKEKYSSHPKIELIFNDENLGFTKGHNAIFEKILNDGIVYEHVVLLNNDTVVEKEWLQNLVNCAEKQKASIVSSKMINYYNRNLMDNAGHKMLNTSEILPIGKLQPIDQFNESFENFGSCGGATLYSREMLQEIGFFDEYFNTGYEDAELGMRAVILGYKCIYEPSAIVYHKESRSVNKILDYKYVLKIQVNIFYSYFKLMPISLLLINLPFFIFKYFVVFLINIIFLRVKFLKVIVHSFFFILFKDRNRVLQSRKEFFSKHQPISSIKILRKQEFFLWFDIKRFFKLIVFRGEMEFEKY